MKKLIIAEKPSLARNIIAAIGTSACTKKDGYYESADYVITWAFGHLFQLIDLEEYDPEYDPETQHGWTMDNLPFVPSQFNFSLKRDNKTKKVDTGVRKQFNTISSLIKRQDIGTIINAGDSDREGEIIVRIILENAKNHKPVERLWMPDQTPDTIKTELAATRSDAEYDNLAREGYARTYIDWLYGINLTRYAALKTGKLLRVGRVTSPIIKAIYDRDMAIRNFTPEFYLSITSNEETNGQPIELTSKTTFAKTDLLQAQQLCDKYNKATTKVSTATTYRKVLPPGKLYSLSKLQGVLGRLYKLSPQDSLNLVQSLYENGYVTYPRTNTEYLATAEKEKTKAIIKCVSHEGYPVKFKDSKAIFDDSKIESHSALTPTTKIPKAGTLGTNEQRVYDVILKRFVAVFCAEDCVVDRSTITIDNGYETFSLKGDVMLEPGWTKYDIVEKKDKILPKLSVGDVIAVNFQSVEKETKPPKHYTTETFNNFLKNPFKDENKKTSDSAETGINTKGEASDAETEDHDTEEETEEYKAIMSGAELGTEATRAALIDAAIRSGYILLKDNAYYITDIGIYYVESLEKLFIDMSKYKTVQLGITLKDVYKGNLTVQQGIDAAAKEINAVFARQNEITVESYAASSEELCKCPKCGGSIRENAKAYACTNKSCGVVIFKSDKFFATFGKKVPAGLAKILFTKGQVNARGLKSQKTGKTFDAIVKVTFPEQYPKYELLFDQPVEKDVVVGKCPKCGQPVKETLKAFACSNADCKFALWKDDKFLGSLGKKITASIARDFLYDGCAYIKKLKSKKTGKEFDASVHVDFNTENGYPKYSLQFPNL